MYVKRDYTGIRSGRLVMLERAEKGQGGYYWKCQCDCGNIVYRIGTRVYQGHIRSCGCLHVDTGKTINLQHGESKSRLYGVWSAMKRRCYNPHDKRWLKYGGRGIKVCDEWKEYKPFRDWAVANGYDETAEYGKCTIDRIDVNGDYEPSNCRFTTICEQAKNKTNNRWLTFNGVTKTETDWAKEIGIPVGTIADRRRHGMPIEKILYPGNLRNFHELASN